MPLVDMVLQPGTLKNPQHTKASEAAFVETDKVHFPDRKLTPIPSYNTAAFTNGQLLTGTCRAQWAATLSGNYPGTYYFFWSNTRLCVVKGGTMYNITPFAGQRHRLLGNNPLSVTNGSPDMVVTWPAHGYGAGDYLTLSGVIATVGGVATTEINKTFPIASVTTDTITVTLAVNASSTATGGGSNVSAYGLDRAARLGADPIATTNGSPTVTVAWTAHNLSAGDRIKIAGATATGGFTTGALNAEHIVTTIVNANSFTITMTSNASSTVAAGGGSVVDVFRPMAAGIENESAGVGWGFGTWGFGIFGSAFESVSARSYPRIGSFDNFGGNIVTCPGDRVTGDGQKIYTWDGNTSIAPYVMRDAPEDTRYVKVVNNSVVALCGRRIDISRLGGDATGGNAWSGFGFTRFDVQRSADLWSTHTIGEKQAIIFAPYPLLLRFTGDGWDLAELEGDNAIIAPLAACRLLDGLEWYGTQGQLHYFNGGTVKTIINTQNGEYVRRRINNGALWHIFMHADQKHAQAWLHYPSSGATNADEYVIHNPAHVTDKSPYGSFTLGTLPRTSAQAPGMIDSRFYMTGSGAVHAHYQNAVPSFNWSAKTAFFYVDDGSRRCRVDGAYVDFFNSAPITLTPYGLETPTGSEITYSPVTVAAQSGHVSMTGAGRLLAFGVSGNADMTVAGMKLDIRQQGRRIA